MKIALIAHDKKKDAMIELATKYRDVLAPHELYATGTTGTLVMGETGLKITRMKSGPLGGDEQIVFFYRHDQQGVIIAGFFPPQLYHVTGARLPPCDLAAKGTDAFVPDHKVIEIFHPRPGGGTLRLRKIIPPEVECEIH